MIPPRQARNTQLDWSSVVRKTSFVAICTLAPMLAIGAETPLGATPPASVVPTIEFAFEERVTIDQPIVLGDTAFGHRQYIPITGGTVAGPKLKGKVVPGGWDFQLTHAASDCTQLSADYFLKADDGTVIHILNEGLTCPGAPRMIFQPKFEAPKGAYAWMTNSTFVATLEIEGTPPKVEAVRIRFYQVK
jgi:hypothetical protein